MSGNVQAANINGFRVIRSSGLMALNPEQQRIVKSREEFQPPDRAYPASKSMKRMFLRLGRFLAVVIILLIIFLLIPFRRWEEYSLWYDIHESIVRVEEDPRSVENLGHLANVSRQFSIIDQSSENLPAGKWYLPWRQTQREATYAIAYVKGLGAFLHGHHSYGLAKLDRLETLKDSSETRAIGTFYSACRSCNGGGELVEECATCQGRGECNRCDGRGELPSTSRESRPTLSSGRSLRTGQQRRPVQRMGELDASRPTSISCSACAGTGECRVCSGVGAQSVVCAVCQGEGRRLDMQGLGNTYLNTVREAKTITKKTRDHHRVLYVVASVQSVLTSFAGGSRRRSSVGATDEQPVGDGLWDETEFGSETISIEGARDEGVRMFYLKWTVNNHLFGPYRYENGSYVGSQNHRYILQCDESKSFTLTCSREGSTFGPFELEQDAIVSLPRADFIVVTNTVDVSHQ